MPVHFDVEATSGAARAGRLVTDHGEVPTPVFMPVGTQATVKATLPETLSREMGARIVLANTYHLVLRPGVEVVEAAGGLHAFMGWPGAILTDSGGYQALSLADLRTVDEDGFTFRSHLDGSLHRFTPESVVEAQARLGADIIMSLDYCPALPCGRDEAERAVVLTTRWARRGRDVFGTRFRRDGRERVVFGIVQGASYEDLRRRSADELVAMDFPGYAVGGLSVGEEKDVMWDMTEAAVARLPAGKPRYLMGVGTPTDLVNAVARGVDMFDCVLPTRNGRNGTVFTRDGKLVLRNARHARDFRPIDDECACGTCRGFTRAYLRHLFMAGEILGPVLATQHNLYFYLDTMRAVRETIEDGTFASWRDRFVERYDAGEDERAGRNENSS